MTLLAVRESGPLASRQVETFLLAQGAAFDLSGDIALNTTHREIIAGNPHGTSAADIGLGNVTDDSQLKRSAADFNSFGTAALALTDIILLESSGGAFAKIKATLQALKDLIGGGGGGGEWTEISRATITTPVSAIEFLNVFSDTYTRYRIRIPIMDGFSATGELYFQFGYGVGPTWVATAYNYHITFHGSNNAGHTANIGTNQAQIVPVLQIQTTRSFSFNFLLWDMREASRVKKMRGDGVMVTPGRVWNSSCGALLDDTANKMDHFRITTSGPTISDALIVIEGAN